MTPIETASACGERREGRCRKHCDCGRSCCLCGKSFDQDVVRKRESNARYNRSESGRAVRQKVNRKYYEKNREKVLALAKPYQQKRKAIPAAVEARKEYRREYMQRIDVKLRYRARNAARDKRIRETSDGSVTQDAIEELYLRQGGLCAITQVELMGVFHLDHVIPLSKGGTHTIGNIQLLTPSANLAKSDKLLDQSLLNGSELDKARFFLQLIK